MSLDLSSVKIRILILMVNINVTTQKYLLTKLNIHKASGPNGLSARVLKECSSEIAPVLAYIFNESLAQGAVPADW